jgi:DNA-directed RNA polymerase subunit RPC12/RpoP
MKRKDLICIHCGRDLPERDKDRAPESHQKPAHDSSYFECGDCGTRRCYRCTERMLTDGGGIDEYEIPCSECGGRAQLFHF